MRKIVNFAVSYPVSVTMVILAILLLGKISYDRLGVDLLPSMVSPRLYIELTTSEKPPTELEKQLVEQIEGVAIRTRDAKDIMTMVRDNGALITVEYQWGKDMEEAFLDLQRAVSVLGQNPDIEEISVSQRDPSSEPIMLLAVSHSDMSLSELSSIAENYVKPQLLSVDGVADVEFNGSQAIEIIVESDPYKLAAFSLTVTDLANKIRENNYRIAGGKIEEMGVRYIVNGSNVLATIEEFNSIVVGYKRINSMGFDSEDDTSGEKGAVYLADVAKVYTADKELLSVVQLGAQECIGVSIYKEQDFNTLKATDEVLKKVEVLRLALPQYDIEVVSNQGEFIDRSISDVKNSAILGMLLAVVVLLVFLRRVGTTLVVSLAIPISIIATFNLLYFGGLTLNIMTLGGLALGAGMLVDNAIVVIESIFRNQEKGMPLKEAIVEGTTEVGGAIIASTLTTIVVFLPIVYLQGQSGELFKEQALSVTFALLSSLFVAIFAIPVMYSKFLKKRKVTKAPVSVKIGGYGKFLGKMLRYRWAVVTLTAIFVTVVFMLSTKLGSEFMPESNSKSVNLDLELSGGATLSRTHSTVTAIEQVIKQFSGDSTLVYSHSGVAGNDGGSIPLSNRAEIKVILDDDSSMNATQLTEALTPYLSSISGLKASFSDSEGAVSSLIENSDVDIMVEIKGENLEVLSGLKSEVVRLLGEVEGVSSMNYDDDVEEQEIVISVDRIVSSIYGVNIQSVIEHIRQHIGGLDAGQMELGGDMCDIKVKLPDVSVSQLRDIEIIAGDKRILLGEIATIKYQAAPNQILRRGQSRIMQVGIKSDSSEPISKLAAEVTEVLNLIDTPGDYSISIEGSEQQRKESFQSLVFALVLSIVLVYMVMASQFESLLHPFTILLTIPLAVAGALLLFLITGNSLNIMAAIGMVMLVGIAVNNSILLVDRIGQLIKEGLGLNESIIQAAEQRVRPILMTSLTTILALLPMAISFGGEAGFQSPMAIAVVGGLVASTVLSLVVIPCVYHIFETGKRILFKSSKTA